MNIKYLTRIFFKLGNIKKGMIRYAEIIIIVILTVLSIASVTKGTIYDLFQDANSFLGKIGTKIIHFKVNGQDMDMFVYTNDDNGALLSKMRNNRSLPFYRDKNGGIAVHVNAGLNKYTLASSGSLMSIIEPIMGFINNSSTKYVSLKLNNGFNAIRFIDTNVYDSDDLPVYPSAQKINTIQTDRFAIGHYKAQATKNAVILYYDARLKSQGYKMIKENDGMRLYKFRSNMFIVNIEEKADYVYIITYMVKNK